MPTRPAALTRGVERLDAIATRVEPHVLTAVAITLPLEFTKVWFPVSWLEVSRLAMVAAILCVSVHLVAGTLSVPRTPLLVAIVAVVAIEATSVLLTRWPSGPKEAVGVAAYATFAVFVAHVLTTRAWLAPLAAALLASGLVVGIASIGQEITGLYIWQGEGIDQLGRRNSTFGDPNITARFLAIVLIVGLAALAARVDPARDGGGPGRRRMIGAVAAVVVVIMVAAVANVLTLSRIGWLTGLLAVAMWIPVALSRRRAAIGIAAFVLAFGGYLTLFPSASARATSVANDAFIRTGIIEPGGARLPDLVLPEDPTATTPIDGLLDRLPLDSVRRYLVRAAGAMTVDHPILGVGLGGFEAELRSGYWKYVPLERRATPTTLLHTDVMRVIAETGLVGFAVWLALLVAVGIAVRRGLHRDDTARLAALAAGSSVIVILTASQFAGRFYTEPYLWLAIGILLAVGRWPAASGRAVSLGDGAV